MIPQVNESDWKLFRSRLPGWQEAYMERLNQAYIDLLSGPGSAADKFWKLEKRVREDKQSAGIIVEMTKSKMELNIMNLLADGAITLDDLSDFSEDLRSKMAFVLGDRG